MRAPVGTYVWCSILHKSMWDNFVAACSCGEARVTRLVFYNAQVNVGRFCYIFFLRRAACGCSLENNALQNKKCQGPPSRKMLPSHKMHARLLGLGGGDGKLSLTARKALSQPRPPYHNQAAALAGRALTPPGRRTTTYNYWILI